MASNGRNARTGTNKCGRGGGRFGQRAVESWCAKNAVAIVTPEILEEIRARMPTPKVFGASAPADPN